MTYHNDLPPRPTTTTITSQLDEANAARETAVSNLQKSRQEGSGLARQYATLAEEHARLQASAQEAAHATAQLEERLRAAHEQLQRVEATGQAQVPNLNLDLNLIPTPRLHLPSPPPSPSTLTLHRNP